MYILKQFNNHCRTFDLMPEYQSAYQSTTAFETALVKIVDDVTSMVFQGIQDCYCYIDEY